MKRFFNANFSDKTRNRSVPCVILMRNLTTAAVFDGEGTRERNIIYSDREKTNRSSLELY